MKTLKTPQHLLCTLLCITITQQLLSQANTTLSNLATPTAVNTSILPALNNTVPLGSATLGWRDVYSASGYSIGSNRILHLLGVNNTFVGVETGKSTVSGHSNTAMGYQALTLNKDGSYNIAIGVQALYSHAANTDGTPFATHNIGIGYRALYSTAPYSLTGIKNVAVGSEALYSNTTGYGNAAIGYQAMYDNTTGYNNLAAGYKSLQNNTTGYYNTALGTQALDDNTDGNYNTAVGTWALAATLHANYNTAVGQFAGGTYNNGGGNTFLGVRADLNAASLMNSVVIGYNAFATASNQVRIGSPSITSIGGYANWTNISDGRAKKNVKENVPGLEFINRLKPVTYNLDLDAIDRVLQTKPVDLLGRSEKEQIVYSGFVAQDVERIAKELGFNFSGVDAAKNDKDLYGLRYAEFVVPLVKAVQELSKENEELKERLKRLEAVVYGTKENMITQKK